MSERYKAVYGHLMKPGLTALLTCHFGFEKATEYQKFDAIAGGGRPICNGCGPSGYGALVPDSLLGVCVTIAGHIHNWGYQFGVDREDKLVIDETFGDNMDRIIRADYADELACEIRRNEKVLADRPNWLTRKYEAWRHQRKLDYLKEMYDSRITLANQVYMKAVQVFGKSAFWDKRPIGFALQDVIGPKYFK